MMTWPVAVVLMVAQPVEGAIPPAQLNDLSDDGVVMCRSSKSSGDHYLPVELFGLDACAGCYRYLPDGPNIFRRKWNTTVLTVPAGSPSSIRRTSGKDDGLSHRSFNVTFLISYDGDDDAVLIVSTVYINSPYMVAISRVKLKSVYIETSELRDEK